MLKRLIVLLGGGLAVGLILWGGLVAFQRFVAKATSQKALARSTWKQPPAALADKQSKNSEAEDDSPAAPPLATTYTWPEIEAMLEQLRAARRENPAATHDLEDLYSRLADLSATGSKDIPEHCANLAQWRRELPNSPTPLIALATAHIAWAWEARGSGWAYTVTPEGWELFHSRITEARRLLEQAVKLGVNDGEAYAQRIVVARAEGLTKEEARAILEEGRKVDPTYYGMYTAMAATLLPRWQGEEGDIEAFAKEVAEMLPGEEGLITVGLIAMHIQTGWEVSEPTTLYWGRYDRELLVKAALALARRYPKWPRAVHFAALCTYAVQDRTAAKVIRPLVGEYSADHQVWPWKNTHSGFLAWCDRTVEDEGVETWLWGSALGDPGFAFAADGQHIWCSQQMGRTSAKLLDVATGRIVQSVPHPGGYINEFAYDPAKDWLVLSAWHGPFTGWMLMPVDEEALSPPVTRQTEEECRALAINPARPQVAWAVGKTVYFYDIEAGKQGPSIERSDYIHQLVYSQDGTKLAVWGDGWFLADTETGQIQCEFRRLDGKRRPIFHCDRVLAVDDQGRAWAIGRRPVYEPRSTSNWPESLVRFSPDGESHEVLIADLGFVDTAAIQLSPDRRFLVTTASPVRTQKEPYGLDIWDVAAGKLAMHVNGAFGREFIFSADGAKLATSADPIKILSLASLVGGGANAKPH